MSDVKRILFSKKVKLTELRWQNLERLKSWQQAKQTSQKTLIIPHRAIHFN